MLFIVGVACLEQTFVPTYTYETKINPLTAQSIIQPTVHRHLKNLQIAVLYQLLLLTI